MEQVGQSTSTVDSPVAKATAPAPVNRVQIRATVAYQLLLTTEPVQQDAILFAYTTP